VSDHELLIRHASAWAAKKKRPLDAGLLETVLDLRSFQDEESANRWPAGSVEHLMLRRWPSHGPGTPDADTLADTLDTFVHFLRATGRMGSGSAGPKELAKEARRAAPRMAQACADIGSHSQTKVLTQFGKEVGIDLESASGVDDLNAKLAQVQAAWNSLPVEERQARMPLTSSEPGVRSAAMTEGINAWLDQQGDPGLDEWDEEWEDEAWLDVIDLLGLDAETPAEPPDLGAVAEQGRQSSFVRSCFQLVEWLAPSKQVTRTGVLRLAPAERAYGDLELWRWQQQDDALRGWPGVDPAAADSAGTGAHVTRLFWWKSAADAVPLERLWYPCQGVGLIETRATVARPAGRKPESNEEWVGLVLPLLMLLWALAQDLCSTVVPALGVIAAGMLRDEPLSLAELTQMWEGHPDNYWAAVARMGGEKELGEQVWASARVGSDSALRQSLHFLDDTGIWERHDDVLELTDLGRAFGAGVLGGLVAGDLTV
jgi:hypothetical protein